MKKFLVLLSGLVVISSCTSGDKKESVQMANPSAVHCINNGGKYIVMQENDGSVGYCIFKDKSACKGWDYYNGKCKAGDCAGACKKGSRGEGYYDCKKIYYGNEPCLK